MSYNIRDINYSASGSRAAFALTKGVIKVREYELTVLIHPDLEMNLQPALDKVKKIVEDAGGKIKKEVDEGKKRLAYPIAGQEFAVYYYFELDLPQEEGKAKKVTDALDISDEILRSLLVTVDDNRLKMEAKRKARKGGDESDSKEADADEATKEKEE